MVTKYHVELEFTVPSSTKTKRPGLTFRDEFASLDLLQASFLTT